MRLPPVSVRIAKGSGALPHTAWETEWPRTEKGGYTGEDGFLSMLVR